MNNLARCHRVVIECADIEALRRYIRDLINAGGRFDGKWF